VKPTDYQLPQNLSGEALQAALLEGVSRTFALTIPQLPNALRCVVANAYLLCRIVDTIEDEVSLSVQQKRKYCNAFIAVVRAQEDPQAFSDALAPLLSEQTIPAEHELIRRVPEVITLTHGYAPEQIEALADCVQTMASGMPGFQAQNLADGLATQDDMDRYCYYVAGCVGEMLTRLFCHYSSDIAANRAQMMSLAVSFGQGLQMTNILKDIWADQQRGVCWLPQSVFDDTGYKLSDLKPEHDSESFATGLARLVSVAYAHLQNALTYTLLIPRAETGIRDFCLWAIGMAVLTLKKIKSQLFFSDSSQVKISRTSVRATVFLTRIARLHDAIVRGLFRYTGSGLSICGWEAQIFKPDPQNFH